MRTILLPVVIVLVAAGCSVQPDAKVAEPAPVAGTAFVGGSVWTGSELIEDAAILVRDGVIAFVGSRADLEAMGRAESIVDLRGGTVVPGLVDAHAHLAALGDALATVDLVGTGSYAEVIERIAERGREEPDEEWITGRGWDQNDWEKREFPEAAVLDEVIGARPVWVRRIDGHAGLASSEAMRRAGVTASTPDPVGGRIVRDGTGRPTGVFIDNAMGLIERAIPSPSRAVRKERIRDAANVVASKGLTGMHDAGSGAEEIALFRELAAEGSLPIRIYVMLTDEKTLLDEWFRRGPLIEEHGLVTVRSVKLYADGALGSRGAALKEPYSDDPHNRGLLVTTPEHILDVARRALAAGFQVGAHAIGDRGNEVVLDAFAAAGVEPRHRFRIEHAQVVDPSDIPPMTARGIIASMQPTHATSDMPWAGDRVGEARLRGAYAWRTILDAGGRLAFGSDFPVEQVSPLDGLRAAVTRQSPDGEPPGGWRISEAMTVTEALAGFSAWAHYAAFEERGRGTIERGMWADLTVLDRNPFRVAPDALDDLEVLYTVVNGRVVYRSE